MRAAARLAHPATHPAHTIENIDVARIFEEIADLLEIQGENPFRIRAYRNAARTIQTLSAPVALLTDKEKALEELPGIGADLAGKIREIVETGTLGLLTQLTRRTPETLVQLMHVPGLGPKRAQLIYKKLHVKTLDDLDRAAHAGKLRSVPGFKQTLERRVLQGLPTTRLGNDIYIRMARDAGALLVISSDAHRTEELKFLRYGVDQARRGWCEPRHIANTHSLDDFRKLLKRA